MRRQDTRNLAAESTSLANGPRSVSRSKNNRQPAGDYLRWPLCWIAASAGGCHPMLRTESRHAQIPASNRQSERREISDCSRPKARRPRTGLPGTIEPAPLSCASFCRLLPQLRDQIPSSRAGSQRMNMGGQSCLPPRIPALRSVHASCASDAKSGYRRSAFSSRNSIQSFRNLLPLQGGGGCPRVSFRAGA